MVAGLAPAVAAQAARAEPEPLRAEPPVDNVFPVPLPYEVGFADSWDACRDGCDRRHKGNDLMADEGTPAVAVEAGVIVKVDNTDEGLGGLTVWLRGASGVAYYYAHNSANLVAVGQQVARGQVIARVGHTGNARTTPPHIHFQINLCGELESDEPCTVDPYPYLRSWAQAPIEGSDAGSPRTSSPFAATADTGGVPLAGDWDGDGRDSVGVYQRVDGTFHLHDDGGAPLGPVSFGAPDRDDVWPLAGDFDGDGRDTVGLYRQSDAAFVVLVGPGVASAPVGLGWPGRVDALPVVGDWDGDGRDSVGVYTQASGAVLRLDDEGRPLAPTVARGDRGPGSYPVVADWDGDGRDEVSALGGTSTRNP